MTLKEAVLKSLDDIGKLTNYSEVYKHIVKNKYFDFSSYRTPTTAVSAQLGDLIRAGDTRVKRIKQVGSTYSYYLTKYEEKLNIDILTNEVEIALSKHLKNKTFDERDLHKLLSSYLKSISIYSKTIFHEQSKYSKDNNQIWIHPDMVGLSLIKLHSKASRNLLKAIDQKEFIKISSYEIKKEINNDNDLKKAFFQAVSNSSWANYGYLVSFEFNSNLIEEMERLNQAFGIGVIELYADTFQSKVHFPAKYRDLDFKTIDKLCKINDDFKEFIEQTEKLIIAEEKYYKSTEKEFETFCDSYFADDTEVEKYCKEKLIPWPETNDPLSLFTKG